MDTKEIEDYKTKSISIANEIIGFTKEKAIAFVESWGRYTRVTKVDGRPMIVTRDYRINRINLNLENDIVVSSNVG